MIGSFKNNRENYPRKCFWRQEKEIRVKFNPVLSANRRLNNWAQRVTLSRSSDCILIWYSCGTKGEISELSQAAFINLDWETGLL